MDKLNSKLFEYYTQVENFKSISEIYQDFPKLEEQLIDEFWDNVNSELVNNINKKEWWVEYVNSEDEDIEISICPKPILVNDKSASSYLSYLDCNSQCLLKLWLSEVVELDYSSIIALAEPYKQEGWKLSKAAKKGEALLWRYADFDFNDIKSYDKILPANRKDMVQRFSSRIIESGITLKPLMEKIHKLKKK